MTIFVIAMLAMVYLSIGLGFAAWLEKATDNEKTAVVFLWPPFLLAALVLGFLKEHGRP